MQSVNSLIYFVGADEYPTEIEYLKAGTYEPRISSSCGVELPLQYCLSNYPFDVCCFISVIHESPVQLGRKL